MSLIVTIRVEEGIVMAGDSRLTSSLTRKEGETVVHDIGALTSESANKVFLAPNHVGISVCNEVSVKGKTISGYLDGFLISSVTESTPVGDVAPMLLKHMRQLNPVPNTIFHVAGYEKGSQGYEARIWRVYPGKNKIDSLPAETPGVCWDGERDIIARLVNPVYLKDSQGNFSEMRTPPIPWDFMTLQDAVDFAVYAIRTTMDTMRFQLRPKTVGGPIDLLVLKPGNGFWVKKKRLNAETYGEPE